MPWATRVGQGDLARWLLDGRELRPGSRVELRMHGNAGWLPAELEPDDEALLLRFRADDGRPLIASLADDDELRWP
jgi:hypothetical protein